MNAPITTAEHLGALPVRAVVRHADTSLYERSPSGWLRLEAWGPSAEAVTPPLPLTVLYRP